LNILLTFPGRNHMMRPFFFFLVCKTACPRNALFVRPRTRPRPLSVRSGARPWSGVNWRLAQPLPGWHCQRGTIPAQQPRDGSRSLRHLTPPMLRVKNLQGPLLTQRYEILQLPRQGGMGALF
jgi:hypothetical protein